MVRSFRTVVLALSSLVLTATACGTPATEKPAAASCPEQTARYCAAVEGELLEVSLDELRPTQPSLGYDEVFYRLGRYTLGAGAGDQLLDQWCATNGRGGLGEANPDATIADPASFTCELAAGSETPESKVAMKTVVIGPGGELYLTDGHHTLTSFWEAPGGGPGTRVQLRVTGNLSTLVTGDFWTEMKDRGWTWLQNADGKSVTPDQLPANLGLKQFADDRYRGALYFVRDVGYSQDDDSPAFQEFYWGQWLREQADPSLTPQDFTLTEMSSYLTLIGNVAKAIVALPPGEEVAGGRTAAELGRLASFGQEAFDALSGPIDSAKPGKLAYAIAYKATL